MWRRKKLYRSIRSIDEKANTHKCSLCKQNVRRKKKKVIIQEYISGEKEWNKKLCKYTAKRKICVEVFFRKKRKENILHKRILPTGDDSGTRTQCYNLFTRSKRAGSSRVGCCCCCVCKVRSEEEEENCSGPGPIRWSLTQAYTILEYIQGAPECEFIWWWWNAAAALRINIC